jgi:hypothetical protein
MPSYSQSETEHVYATEEVTYGTPVTPVAADAFKVIRPGPTMKPEQAVIRGNEKTGSRSQSPSLPCGSISSTIEVPVYVEPSGTAGTPPDANRLYKNLMGAEVIGAGEVRYELRDPVPSTLSVFSYIQQLPQVSVGTVFNQGVFSFDGELLKCVFTGIGMDVLIAGLPTEPAPPLTYSGLPLARGCGSATIDGDPVGLIDFTCTINNGDVARPIPIGSKVSSGISRGIRSVTAGFTLLLTDTTKDYYQMAKDRTSVPIVVTIGDVVGKMFTILLPQMILNTPDIDKTNPEVQMAFTAEAWGVNNEEMVIRFH